MKRLFFLGVLLGWGITLHAALIQTTVNQPIPDGDWNGLASTVNLTGFSGPIGSLQVELNIAGTYNGDLYAYLTHGSGFTVLLNRVGRTASDGLGYGDAGLNVTFSDGVADVHNYRQTLFGNNNVPMAGPLTGSWGPDGRAVLPNTVTDATARTAFLSSFDGLDPNGQWTLFVADVSGGDLHQLNGWSLEIDSGAGAVPIPDSGSSCALLLGALAVGCLARCALKNGQWAMASIVTSLVIWTVSAIPVSGAQGRNVTGWGSMRVYPLEGYGQKFKQISAGDGFGLALTESGTVIAWGRTESGLSDPPPLQGVAAVSAGVWHSLALRSDGTVAAWGLNNYGQCDVPNGLNGVVAVAAGYGQSLALKSDGTVVAWGCGGGCQMPENLTNVKAIAAGGSHSLALRSDGTVVAWGDNSGGQCDIPPGLSTVVAIAAGDGQSLALKEDGTVVGWGSLSIGPGQIGYPTPPEGLTGVVAISAGALHSVALKSDGTVVAWGWYSGQIAVPPGLSDVIAISARGFHTLALRKDGTVAAWGDTYWGQSTSPSGISDVVRISCSKVVDQTFAVKADGTVTGWGQSSGWLPSGLTDVKAVAPAEYSGLVLHNDGTVEEWTIGGPSSDLPPGLNGVVAIATGNSHSVALKATGEVIAWGSNFGGAAIVPSGLGGVVAIDAGYYFSVALRADGTVVAWGINESGQCDVPAALTGVTAIAAGSYHVLALLADGRVVAWGDNSSGQCDVPVGLGKVRAIAAGERHSVALLATGTVVAWGNNDSGQCDIPPGLARVAATGAGYRHTAALFGGANEPPFAPGYYLQATRDTAQSLAISKLQRACSDPDGDPISISGVNSPSAAGAAVQLNAGAIVYTPPAGFVGSDAFTYTVQDNQGASSQGTVRVTVSAIAGSGPNVLDVTVGTGGATIHFAGVPGVSYWIQASNDLITWLDLSPTTAGANGLFEFVDPDAGSHIQRYYRTWTSAP